MGFLSIYLKYFFNWVCFLLSRMAQNLNRSIRAHQDEAFLESLRADQEKDRVREEQRRRLEEAERQKETVRIFLLDI